MTAGPFTYSRSIPHISFVQPCMEQVIGWYRFSIASLFAVKKYVLVILL